MNEQVVRSEIIMVKKAVTTGKKAISWTRPVLLVGAAFVLGTIIQNNTGIFKGQFKSEPEVYSKPYWYSVTRMQTTINYQASGERLIECEHKAPLTADLLDSNGDIVARELVRKAAPPNNPSVPSGIPTKAMPGNIVDADKVIVGTPKVDKNPRKFTINNFIIISDANSLQQAVRFVIRSECSNVDYGRVTGKFGPFPIPKDGATLAKLPDVMKPPAN